MKVTGTAVMRNRKRIRVIISDCADTARWSVIHMVSLPVSHDAGNSFDKMLSSIPISETYYRFLSWYFPGKDGENRETQ